MLDFTTYLSDDVTTAAGALAFSTVAGTESAEVELHFWASKGSSGGRESSLWIEVQVYDTGSGTWKSSGLPALDEYHFSISLTGYTNSSSDTMLPQVCNWTRLGTNKVLPLLPMPGNSCRKALVRYRPKLAAGTASETLQVRFVVVTGETALGVSNGLGRLGDGILRLARVRDRSDWVDFPAVTQTGTPDAYVQISRRSWYGRGVPRRALKEAVLLNQTGSSGSLTSGQAYKAVLSQPVDGGAITVTKGARAASASAVAPAMPADALYVATVTVVYQAGGTSVISTSNIAAGGYSGEFAPASGSGLTVTIGPGEAIVGGQWVRLTGQSIVALAASSTTRVWLSSSGAFELSTSADTPTTEGALWICTAVTDGSTVTTLTDKRAAYYHPAGIASIALLSTATESVGAGVAYAQVPSHCYLVAVTAGVLAPSSGATGSTVLDVHRSTAGGTYATLYTGQGGSPESRPVIAAQGSSDLLSYPEVTELLAGDVVRLDIDTATTGGTQSVGVAAALLVSLA